MKLFSGKKKTDKQEEEEKKKKITSDTGSSVAVSDTPNRVKKLEDVKPSKDSDLGKQRLFAGMFKPGSKGKQNEPAKANTVTTEVTETKEISASEQQPVSDRVRKLIEVVSLSIENAIIPSISLDEGRVSFPLLAEAGEDKYDINFLEELASPSANILERGVSESFTVCPDHPEFLATSIRLYCVRCSSAHIAKLQLAEHKLCGYIGEKKDFLVETEIKCPSCNNVIKNAERELRMVGMWYRCNDCDSKFDNPVIKLHCRKFNHDFGINQAEMVTIPYYKLKKETKRVDVDIFSLIPQLKQLLISHGFTVEESSAVKGKSGVEHMTNIYAYNNQNKTILIDIRGSDTGVDDTEVVSTFVKVLDIYPTKAIFIGIPSVSDKAKAMAAAHNISIVTGRDFSEIFAMVDQILSKGISTPANTINKIE